MDTVHSTRTPPRVAKSVSQDKSSRHSTASKPAHTLAEIKLRLEIISSTVAVVVGALEGQGADLDLDVAHTLRTCVRSALADQIEQLATLADQLK